MQTITKRIGLLLVILFISCCLNSSLNAQTPADDPGIGGPGVGAAPAGDGSPIVPFDGTMNLFLLVSGVAFASYTAKNKLVLNSLWWGYCKPF